MLIRFAGSLVVVVSFLNLAIAAPPDPKKTGWFLDFAQAKAEAQRTGKPLLVVIRCER